MALFELQGLVDAPNETLSVEYKAWLDLNDNEARADIARHIAAIANYGGGYIVFGFDDTTLQYVPDPFGTKTSRDVISSIVKKYLEPTFQCDVSLVRSSAGNEHPIVIVPPHGATPICAKANGPMDGKKVQGIIQGQYYLRKAGPESAPILTAAEWNPVIRRCAMHERASILGALDVALRGVQQSQDDDQEGLKKFHEAAHVAFMKEASEKPEGQRFANSHWQLSYQVERSDKQQLLPHTLLQTLREINSEVHELVRSGWSMFYLFDRPEIRPNWRIDEAAGIGERDFLECAHLRDPRKDGFRFADLWRVATDGKATLIRDYWEDGLDWNNHLGWPSGTWLSPNLLAKALAELVRHARGMTERFDNPTSVSFRIEWHGLNGRMIRDPEGLWMANWRAGDDHRVSVGSWPVTSLTNAWPEIVAALAAPLMRSFTTEFNMSPSWVQGQAPRWLR